ncbi:trypsin-like peptidase domain-containing protein [Novosphingobium sp. 1Y9A]|uniref:Trypsin-like peptidase domain-containing protein n=2 Tax=Novosphingobium jiangmenense TaxID=2791981 RepID=A0ABS0HHQ2_9SPHN|nr:trypsin-like peptidase domain-containing protein [Novosphingobium jiangmenense]
MRSKQIGAKSAVMRVAKQIIAFLVALLALASAPIALADPADISAASRSVVRVVIIESDGDRARLITHGTGFAVTPNLIVTNAHVVEELRGDDTLIAGVVPAEGRNGYPAKLVAYSPGNDLALLRIEGGGTLTPITLFPGAPGDGSEVYAVGYPGNVDLAQGLSMADLVTPQEAVKTRGYLSGGRSSRSFDTLLHTAPLGSGNSGGPLLDSCGRVIGVNSFGTVSDNSTDSSFYFAISMRELAAFLLKAKVDAHTSGLPCRSIADLDRAEAQRAAGDQARLAAESEARAQASQQALEKARREAEMAVLSERDNGMALAALLLVGALGVGGWGMVQASKRRGKFLRKHVFGAAALLVSAIAVWFLRPSLTSIDSRAKEMLEEPQPSPSASTLAASNDGSGRMICVLDPERSRVTVSDITDVPIDWNEGGCMNGKTQYGLANDGWSRILVPNGEEAVSVNSYDPQSRTYTVERFLVGLDAMTQARAARAKLSAPACGAGEEAARQFGQNQQAIKALLPPEPNERMRYNCQPAP